MLFNAHYILSPKKELIALLETHELTLSAHFGRSSIWTREEGGYGSPTEDQSMAAIRLLFIAHFRSVLLRLNISNKQQFLDEIMGSPPFSTDVFDKWWTIERLHKAEDFRDVVDRIAPEQFDLLAETGIPKIDYQIEIAQKLNASPDNGYHQLMEKLSRPKDQD